MECPNCGKVISQKQHVGVIGVYRCQHCEALVGECYLGESYTLVRPFFAPKDVPFEQTRYFDFTTLGSEGIGRRHGWYDPDTRLIVQVG